MISSELRQAVRDARAAIPLEREWWMMNRIPEGIPRTSGADAPAEYLELLSLTEGPNFGAILVYDAKRVEKYQFYADEVEGAAVRLGRDLWFFFGLVNEDPLFINRQDGTVWGFPDRGIVWRDNDVFERFADSLGEFLERYALGSEYLAFSGSEEDDQWWRLLMHIGRV